MDAVILRPVLLYLSVVSLVAISSFSTSAEWYVSPPPFGSDSHPGTEHQPFATIQKGIDAASGSDTVIVAEGTYVENIQFNGKDIVLASANPLKPTVAANTIIDGNKLGSVVTFSGTETQACVLSGFTIQSGEATNGGGICGGTELLRTLATIEDCIIRENHAFDYGGAVVYCDGTIRGNLIHGNIAGEGGGVAYCNGLIQNNTVEDNHGRSSGGGFAHCHGVIRNNTIAANEAEDGGGGGLYDCDGAIRNNVIRANWAWVLLRMQSPGKTTKAKTRGSIRTSPGFVLDELLRPFGRGAGLCNCDGTILNNVITENWAIDSGGGLALCHGTVQSNLVAGNRAHRYGAAMNECNGVILSNTVVENESLHASGGLHGCLATIRNCILWENVGPDKGQLLDCSEPSHSCVQGWTAGGNNTSADPCFLVPGRWDDNNTTGNVWDDAWVSGDYRLREDSPCVDAGDNSLLLPPGFDMAGQLRIVFGRTSLTVDMGSYEFHSVPFTVSLVAMDDHGFELIWNSQPNDTYIVGSCTDPSKGLWIREATVAPAGAFTWWTDPVPARQMRFYRIEMEETGQPTAPTP